MTIVLKKIDVSVAYTIWSGLGTALIVGIGIIWFKESITLMKMISIIFIIIGVIGLKLSSGAQ